MIAVMIADPCRTTPDKTVKEAMYSVLSGWTRLDTERSSRGEGFVCGDFTAATRAPCVAGRRFPAVGLRISLTLPCNSAGSVVE